jgi:NAD(P)H-quinone oxidoreductase subunit 5
MAHLHHPWSSHKAVLLCIPPLLYFLGGVGGRLASKTKLSVSKAWHLARSASTAVLLFSVACCWYALWNATSLVGRPHIASIFSLGSGHLSFRFDLIESLMLLLVTLLGWVIVNYSHAYMAGDPRESVYIGRLMHTLAAVTLLVVTNSMAVFLIAWILTSLALHGLLTLYPNRQAAVIAAHKKFLASRLGDVTLLGGVLLLRSQTGSFELDQVVDCVSKLHAVPLSIHIAALLLSISALIKCAQLPLHGWLIQVMEAPTPVSALLHAGIVNLGGFMLIRLASVINTTPAAQTLLVVVGCLTAIIGSLVMTTRISIKVHLAWSTCAQMGFMLMECGLGLYALAFLHLLAHSLYKAHAFLVSGGTVNQAKLKSLMPAIRSPKVYTLLASGLCGLIVASLSEFLWRPVVRIDATAGFCIAIVGLAVAGILATVRSIHSAVVSLILTGTAFSVSILYFGYDTLFQKVVPTVGIGLVQHETLPIFALVCFGLLYGIQTMIRVNPLGGFATALYPWFYAGLYLDEVFTRATFRLWPANHISKAVNRRDAVQPFESTGESR